MKKRLHALWPTYFISIVFSLSFPLKNFSQSLVLGNEKTKIEIGINIGPSFFLGDLGGNRGKGTPFLKDINFPYTKIMKGIFLSYISE